MIEFRKQLEAHGLFVKGELIGDGKIHRFAVEGDRAGETSGWYVLYEDHFPAGMFGNWRGGSPVLWHAHNGRELTVSEKVDLTQKFENTRREREAETEKRRNEAAEKAARIIASSLPASVNHPYLMRKGVKAHGLVEKDEKLIIPLMDNAGKLHSLQFVDVTGVKRFLPCGQKHGHYHMIGGATEKVCIAEGFATAASIHEATGYACVVAFDAANLLPVSQAIRKRFPSNTIIICADDDFTNPFNPGLTKATEAAKLINAYLATTGDNTMEDQDRVNDFNDLHLAKGREAVSVRLEAAQDPLTTVSAPETEIARLASLSEFEYEQQRANAAKTLGVRTQALDNAVVEAKRKTPAHPSQGALFPEVLPYADPIDPIVLFQELLETFSRHIICNKETQVAAVLWCAFTWLIDYVSIAPLAIITAPEKRCGKTQMLNLIGKFVKNPLAASNISAAAIFRVIDAHSPTLLIDEVDTFLGNKEEAVGILNSGHSRGGAFSVRLVGEGHDAKPFKTWGAKALSGIGTLPGTLRDRGITLELRRKLPGENVERLRYADEGTFERLASMLCRFADDSAAVIQKARPALPEELNDRQQDNWEPLLAIADYIGGDWPSLARSASIALSADKEEALGGNSELLADIRDVFECSGGSRISSETLLRALCEDDTKPWLTLNRGGQMTPRQLSERLREYGISPRTTRGVDGQPGTMAKGYTKEDFADVFARYLPPLPSASSVTA